MRSAVKIILSVAFIMIIVGIFFKQVDIIQNFLMFFFVEGVFDPFVIFIITIKKDVS